MMMAAIAAAALSSCTNSEVVDLSAGRAIGFETYVGKAGTRGVPVSGTKFADASTMRVWGYYSASQMGTTFGSQTALPNLGGVKVTKDATAWGYSPLAYWKDNQAHSFFACAPYTEAGVSFAGGVMTYTVQESVDDQVDFMVADAIKNTVWNGTDEPTKQVFTFHHALSQIKYSAKITEDLTSKATEITVKSIMIQNLGEDGATASTLATTGVISIVGKTGTGDVTYTGDHTGTNNGYTITPTTAVALANASTTPEYAAVNHKEKDVLMLMPQTTTGKVMFTVKLGYKDASDAPAEAEATFITTEAQTWLPNKIYHYKFDISIPQVLNQKPIEFGEPTIVDWDNNENAVTPGQQGSKPTE